MPMLKLTGIAGPIAAVYQANPTPPEVENIKQIIGGLNGSLL